MRSIFISVFVAGSIFLLSCGNRDQIVVTVDFQRDSVIEKELLKNIIVEIFLIEGSIYKAQIEGKDIQYYSNSYYDCFFAKNKINRRRILKSVEYYTSRREIEEIMQEVVSTLMELDIQTTQESNGSDLEMVIPEQTSSPEWIEKITEN